MNQNKLTCAALAASILALGGLAANAQTPSSDALLNKLVEKGILSTKEAEDLRKETSQDFTKKYKAQTGLPDWVTNLKFNGDFRGRYDGVFQNSANTAVNQDRHRLRYRVRFGATATLTDHFEVGLRLGSGEVGSAAPSLGGSPYSANTTFNNDASRKFIFVDLAYAKWTPCKSAQLEIGKMNNALWFTDMTMDPDYNPEGAQEKFGYDLNDKHRINLTAGQFVIAENFAGGGGVNNDVYLLINQLDWTAKWTKKISSRAAVAAMNFNHQKSIPASLETFINQNGTSATGAGAPNFNPIIARAEGAYLLGSFPGFKGEFPITLGAEYVNNPGAGSRVNEAYNFGLTLGSAKNRGNWQLSYNYKNIEAASVWHGLNDDDFGFDARGGTDVRGHQIIASYHPYSPLFVNVRFMKTEQINNAPGAKAEQDRLFFDLLWTF